MVEVVTPSHSHTFGGTYESCVDVVVCESFVNVVEDEEEDEANKAVDVNAEEEEEAKMKARDEVAVDRAAPSVDDNRRRGATSCMVKRFCRNIVVVVVVVFDFMIPST